MAHIEVVPALPEQQPILANLLELYAHDFSEFLGLDLKEDGRFGYQQLPLYWSQPNRHAFLVRMDGKLAGFVFVTQGSEVSGNQTVWDMTEFFVVRAYRRRGIGTEIAHQVWRRFPGVWQVRVMESNDPARHFWERAIPLFTGQAANSVRVEKSAQYWHVFSFESNGRLLASQT